MAHTELGVQSLKVPVPLVRTQRTSPKWQRDCESRAKLGLLWIGNVARREQRLYVLSFAEVSRANTTNVQNLPTNKLTHTWETSMPHKVLETPMKPQLQAPLAKL